MCHEPLHVTAADSPLQALPAPDSDHLPVPTAPSTGALDERVVEQMLIELAAADDDIWAARSRKFATRRSQLMLGLGVGVGVVLLILVVAAVVGRIVG